jgi:hypothetical protein
MLVPSPGMESMEKIPPDSSVPSFMVESLSRVRDEPLRETAAGLNPLIQSLHSRNLLHYLSYCVFISQADPQRPSIHLGHHSWPFQLPLQGSWETYPV